MASTANESAVPPLVRLAAAAFCRDWGVATPPPLVPLPTELCKAVWKEVRAAVKRHDRPLSCKDMFPFVRTCWGVEGLDLCDAAKWVTDASLHGLGCIHTLKEVRLTSCKFISDDAISFALRLPLLQTLDLSWTDLSDAAVTTAVGRCASLTSLNLTGLTALTDAAVSSLLALTHLQRLSLACTHITDQALDYLTYYSRYPDAGPSHLGLHHLRRLELSSTKLTDTGVGKLIAVVERGTPYGKVFKQLEYLALSSTHNVTPPMVRQVRSKYGFDTPLPNAPRTLAKSNAVALDAQSWVLRLPPTERTLTPAPRSWEQERVLAYVAAYTKEMAAATDVIRRLTAADNGSGPPINPPESAGPHAPPAAELPDAKRARGA